MQQQGLDPVAVMLGHEDWLSFSIQSKVAYTPFGSARRYQPALGGLLLVRIDEMQAVRVVTQGELDPDGGRKAASFPKTSRIGTGTFLAESP